MQALSILAPFIGDELGVDADLGKVGLHHFADALAVGIVRSLDRHVPKINVERRLDARGSQRGLGLLGVVGVIDDVVVVGPHRARDQGLGLLAGAEIDILDDGVAVDGHAERLTHFPLVKGRLGRVERPVRDVEAGHADHLERRILLHFGEIGRPGIGVDVAFARLQLGVARRCIGRDGEDEVVDERLFTKVVLVGLVADHRILLIGDKGKRARAHGRLVELLGRSLLEEEVGVFGRTDRHEVHRQVGEDSDIRRLEPHDHGVVVFFLDRIEQARHVHVVEIVVLAAGDLVVGVVRLPLPVDREQHVVSVEVAARLEILHRMELDALAQMERDRLAAVGDVPTLGEARNDLGRATPEFGQAIVDGARRVEAGASRIDRRSKVFGAAFGAIDQSLGRGRACADE